MGITLSVLTLVLVCATIYILQPVDRKWNFGERWHLPPGPKGSLVLGNLTEFLRCKQEGRLFSWLEQIATYGEMTTFHMGSQLWVVLNSNQAVTDILLKNPRTTLGRPHMPVADGLISKGKRSVLYKEQQWSESRRMMRSLLNNQALGTYANYQDIESIKMLKAYLETPKDWHRHHAHYGASILYRSVMGAPFKKSTAEIDEFQLLIMSFLKDLMSSRVDYFPMLRYLPLQPWRRSWQAKGDHYERVVMRWSSDGAKLAQAGKIQASFVRDFELPEKPESQGFDNQVIFLANTIMSAGSDNMRMTMNAFIMASVCFPTPYARARQEIDSTCGGGGGNDDNDDDGSETSQQSALRLPYLSDVGSMPYLQAFVMEVLRWRPVVPIGIQRELGEALSYKGYRFPPGTNFLINTVTCCKGVEDPDDFQPERWMDATKPPEQFFFFGAGRRNCVGYKFAEQGLIIALSRLIYCFDFAPVILCEEKQAGPIDSENLNPWTLGEPFPIKATCRSRAHAQLIKSLLL